MQRRIRQGGRSPQTGRGLSSMSHPPYHRRASLHAPPPAPGFRFAPLGHGEEETCASAALSEAGACPLARAGQARSRPPQANATTSTILSHTITLSSQHRASQLYPPTRAPVRNAPLLTPLCSAPRRPLPEPTCPSRGQVGSLCVSRPYAELPRFVLSGCCVGPPYGRGTACGAHILCRGCRGAGLAQNPGLSAKSLHGRLLKLPISPPPLPINTQPSSVCGCGVVRSGC